MTEEHSRQLTVALRAAAQGSADAAEFVWVRIHTELRRLARARMRRVPSEGTLQPTALVHEAFIRLLDKQETDWASRRHFFASAGRAMRDILVERARKKARPKHGGAHARLDLAPDELSCEPPAENILWIHEALSDFECRFPRPAEVVTLRYFAGLSEADIAEAMGVDKRTVQRDWAFARSWLQRRLSKSIE